MSALNTFSVVLDKLTALIYSEKFKADSCMKKSDFTRNRKFTFADYMFMALRNNKKSLQIMINGYLDACKGEAVEYSKQAFSKGRLRIKPTAFLTILHHVAEWFYEESQWKTYRGYRVLAVDGTKYNLPNSKEAYEAFGSEDYGVRTIVQGLGSCLFDVLNGIVLDASLYPHNGNERVSAAEHGDYLEKIRTEKELILLDRGYPSQELIYTLDNHGFAYLMRTNKDNFLSEIRDVKSDDEIVDRQYKDTVLKIRVVTVQVENTTETLLTNLPESFTIEDLKYLYHLRWCIETLYNELKNQMEVENFSGISEQVVMQDFYATFALQNLIAIAEFDAQNVLDKADKPKKLKYKRKINSAMAIGEIKRNFIKIVTSNSLVKPARLFDKLQKRIMKNAVSIREGRSFKRENKHRASKFHTNIKSVD